MLSNIIIALVVLMTILSGASAYMYYTHDVTDHDEVILATRVPMPLKGLVLDNPGFVNMYYVDGELACSTDKGTISLVVALEGSEPVREHDGRIRNNMWSTARVGFIMEGSYSLDTKLFSTWLTDARTVPDVNTTYSCTGLGYHK